MENSYLASVKIVFLPLKRMNSDDTTRIIPSFSYYDEGTDDIQEEIILDMDDDIFPGMVGEIYLVCVDDKKDNLDNTLKEMAIGMANGK